MQTQMSSLLLVRVPLNKNCPFVHSDNIHQSKINIKKHVPGARAPTNEIIGKVRSPTNCFDCCDHKRTKELD
jgi:hypothetical protein